LVDALRGLADAKGATVAQLAIAWVLSRGQDIVPLVGARRRDGDPRQRARLDLDIEPARLDRLRRRFAKDAEPDPATLLKLEAEPSELVRFDARRLRAVVALDCDSRGCWRRELAHDHDPALHVADLDVELELARAERHRPGLRHAGARERALLLERRVREQLGELRVDAPPAERGLRVGRDL